MLLKKLNFCGTVFSGQGISADPAKKEAIKRADAPNSVIDVRSLLGMAKNVSCFILNYADIVAPLSDQDGKRNTNKR